MTKKKNKRSDVRKIRRILNKNPEVLKSISGHKLHKIGYGSGLRCDQLREDINETEFS